VDINAHNAGEVFFGGVGDVADETDAGVIDEDVEVFDVLDGGGDRSGVGDVHRDGFGVGKFGCEGLSGSEVEVGD